MSVNLQKWRVAVVFSSALQIIVWCDLIFVNEIGETFRDYRGKALPFMFRQAVCPSSGVDSCGKEDFVGINIADACKLILENARKPSKNVCWNKT